MKPEFPEGIINSIAHAQLRGSFDDMKKLIEFLQEYPCSSGQIEQILNVLSIHLNPRTHPTPLSSASLYCILALTATNLACKESSQAMVDHLTRFWPKLWSWLKYFHDNCITNLVTYPNEERRQFKSTFIKAIHLFSQEERLATCLWSTPGVVPTLISLWRQEITDPGISLSEESGLPGTYLTSTILSACFSAMHEQACQSWIDNVVIPSGGDPKDFASIALAHLHHDLTQKQQGLYHLIHDIRVLIFSSCYLPFRNSLLSLDSIHAVTRVLVDCTSEPYSAQNAILAGESINCCFWYLVEHLESMDGTHWIVRALDAHLLCALLKSEPWAEHLRDPYMDILSNILPKYLVHRSVLLAASRALARVRDLQLEEKISHTGLLWIKWSQFRDLIDEGMLILRDVSSSPDRMGCSNKKCLGQTNSNGFKICSGCHHAMYCGKSCQSFDWKHGGHRDMCMRIRARQQEGSMCDTSSREGKFQLRVVHREISKHREEILMRTHQETGSFLLDLDFNAIPVHMTIRPLEDFSPPGYNNDLKIRERWDAIVTGLEEASLVIRSHIPLGESVAISTLSMSMASFRGDGQLVTSAIELNDALEERPADCTIVARRVAW